MLSNTLLLGNLASDLEIKQAGDGRVAKFRLATDESWMDRRTNERKKKTTFHFVEVWKAGVIDALDGLQKGDAVVVHGIIQISRYDDNGETKYSHTIAVKGWDHFVASNLYVARESDD